MTLAMHKADVTREDWTVAEACKRLADAGADVVGLNCIRGPATMMPLLRTIRGAIKTPMAALPVPYRTTEGEPSFQSLCDTHWHFDEGTRPFPVALDPSRATATRSRSSRRMRTRSASATSAYAAAPVPTIFARWRKPWASTAGQQVFGGYVETRVPGSHERIKQVQKDYASKL
jgi:hypothetical protein